MDQNFQQLDLQSLIDLLAEETEKYTKAFISGNLLESAFHRAKMEALIAEIEQRKQGKFLPTDIGLENPPDNISDATPTTT
jgi:hypothetical protein